MSTINSLIIYAVQWHLLSLNQESWITKSPMWVWLSLNNVSRMGLSLRTLNSFPHKNEGRIQVESYQDVTIESVCLIITARHPPACIKRVPLILWIFFHHSNQVLVNFPGCILSKVKIQMIVVWDLLVVDKVGDFREQIFSVLGICHNILSSAPHGRWDPHLSDVVHRRCKLNEMREGEGELYYGKK